MFQLTQKYFNYSQELEKYHINKGTYFNKICTTY